MLLDEYQKSAFRTNPDLGQIHGLTKDFSLKVNLSHMALGISSEVDEVDAAYSTSKYDLKTAQKNLTDEIGDLMWYVAGWCTYQGYELKLVALQGTKMTAMYQAAFKLDDFAKKFLAYGKEFGENDKPLLGDLIHSCQIICGQLEIDFAEVLKKNIEKLKVRYPADKFDQDAAINRDVEAEKKVFEDGEKVETGISEIDEKLREGISPENLSK